MSTTIQTIHETDLTLHRDHDGDAEIEHDDSLFYVKPEALLGALRAEGFLPEPEADAQCAESDDRAETYPEMIQRIAAENKAKFAESDDRATALMHRATSHSIRETALNFAVQSVPTGTLSAHITQRAEVFEGYLKGDEAEVAA